MALNDEKLNRIEDKQDKILEHLSDLRKDFAVHVTEDHAMKTDVDALKRAVPGLQKTATLARAGAAAIALMLGSAGAWATGLFDLLRVLGKH